MELSRTKIDKSGERLAKDTWTSEEQYIESEIVLDDYRKLHLEPLTEITLRLQSWLHEFGKDFYIAQRIKRKPQILRKLKRFHVRLSQLQDIGGVRVIFDDNTHIDGFVSFMKKKIAKGHFVAVERETDYREYGRDDSGYRAFHLILSRNNVKVELQLRSRIQHNWAERIERTSVIYGYYLKELQGDSRVLEYFKSLSYIFHEIENKRNPSANLINELETRRHECEKIIQSSDKKNVFKSSVNENFLKGMISRDANLKASFHNWMIVFDWSSGAFLNWRVINGKSDEAIKVYVELEKQYPAETGYEVVMIGSSDVTAIRKTHSHYFGIETYDTILQSIDSTIVDFNKKEEIDERARTVLQCLIRRGNWNAKKISFDTLKNHYCRDIEDIEEVVNILERMGFIIKSSNNSCSLNMKKRDEIEKYVQ
jgi:ppGpp synthetase/RelA/SpoT-type nucleotidyltranferase